MKTVFLSILLLVFCVFSQEITEFRDTMFVVDNLDTVSINENIVKTVPNTQLKTRGIVNSIAFESGIQKDRSGAIGNFEKFSVRGISSSRLGVFVDGNSVANAGGGAVDLSRFDGLNIKNIKVYKGFVPAELGGNILGGAVNIITEKTALENAAFSPSVFVLAGSFGEFRANSNINNIPLGSKTKLSLSADWHSAKNDYKYMDYNGTFFNNTADDTIRTMDNNEFRSVATTASVKTFHKNFDLDGNFSFLHSKYEIPSAGVRWKFRNRTAHDKNNDYIMSLNQKFHNKFNNKINISAMWSEDAFLWTNRDNISFPYSLLLNGTGEVASKNLAIDGGYFHKFDMKTVSLELFGNARFEKINYVNKITGFDLEDRGVERLSGSLSADLSISPPYPEIVIGGTIRGYADRINDWTKGFVYENIPDDTILDVDKSVRLGINSFFAKQPLQIFADAVFADKIPNLRQRYGYYGTIPSPKLRSEKVFSAQTGLIADFYNIKISTAFFMNYSRDLIRVIYYRNIGQSKNISEARVLGIENNIAWRVFEKLELQNNITLQEPVNLSEKSIKKLYLPDESRLKINTEMKIGDFAGVSLIPSMNFKSAYFHDLYNYHRVPFNEKKNGLAFFNFILQYEIKSLQFQAGVYDICSAGNSPEKLSALENQYFTLRYPGISFKGSVKWQMKNRE